MNFGSLFSGVGMLDLGLQNAGMVPAWQVEIDDFARSVLARRFPNVPQSVDVREVGARNLEPVDLIAGGFPCQDISSAGKRAGLSGARSGLWREYARILGELRPRWVLVENVARLIGHGLDVVLEDLAALGYDAEWDVISAAAVGAPHLRERVWIVAWDAARVRLPDPVGVDLREQRERLREQRRQPRERSAPGNDADRRGSDVADAASERLERRPGHGGKQEGARGRWAGSPGSGRIFDAGALAEWRARCEREVWARAESRLGGAPDGSAAGLDRRPIEPWERGIPRAISKEEAAERRRAGEQKTQRLKAIGNGVVAPIVEWLGGRILEADRRFAR